MRPTSALVVAAPTLLSLGLGSPLAAQQIVPLTDAPFSARLSVTENEGRTYPPELSRHTRDMAAGCVTGLLNRLMNTHIGLITPLRQAARPQPDQARITE
jgi:hypothetical protein